MFFRPRDGFTSLQPFDRKRKLRIAETLPSPLFARALVAFRLIFPGYLDCLLDLGHDRSEGRIVEPLANPLGKFFLG